MNPLAGLVFEGNPGGKPSLGDFNVVNRLVTEFAQDVIGVRKDFHSGKPGADKPIERIEALAGHFGDIFMGRNAEFAAQPWNNPIRLGSKIRVLCSDAAQYDDEGKALFIWLARNVVRSSEAVENGEMTDEQAGKRLRDVLDSVVAMLLGIR
jgi:hypothetical protein